MPRYQDVIGRHAQPRALTSKAAAATTAPKTGTSAGQDSTGQALYTGAWYYDGTARYAATPTD